MRPTALIVTPKYLPLLGGMERECALLAAEFERRGFDPVVLTEQLGLDLPRRERSGAVTIVRIPSSPRRSVFVQLRVAAALALLLLRHRHAAFAVVRTTTLPSLVVGLLKRLRLVRFPTFVTAETGGVDDDVAALARRPLFPLSRLLVSSNDVLNGLCKANADHLREHGFPREKITMIPNGIDTTPWDATRPPDRVERFLFLGRIDPEKGIFELADAFAQVHRGHPATHLTIAGEGDAEDALRRRVDELGLDGAVDFVGRVPYERLGDLFGRVDALVLPSYSEGMPLSVLEAAAHRRVLVITDVGDVKRMFGDRIRTLPPRDAAALAATMEAAVNDPEPDTDYGDVIAAVSIENVADAIIGRLSAL
jgi:glycosyltransferase involved in cell wall biosynthesis